jgi:nitroreductase
MITMYYHALEKGLSHPEPRPGFGTRYISGLLTGTHAYVHQAGLDETARAAVAVLEQCLRFCELHGLDRGDERKSLNAITTLSRRSPEGCDFWTPEGTLSVTRLEIQSAGCLDLTRFFGARYSVRNFSEEPVADSLIEKAISLAQKTPSVCNRQEWRVHVYSDPDTKRDVLDCQWGNRGFGHLASHVLLVTTDLRFFTSERERFQGWIDGGMLSMSIIYALHSLGLGSCPLNCSTNMDMDASLRRAANIPDNELIIMMIAVGNLRETFKVARSSRRNLQEMILWHTQDASGSADTTVK